MALIPFFFFYLVVSPPASGPNHLAFALFTLAAATDWLDGFIARADGSLDFLPEGGGEPHGYNEFYASVDAVVIGRKTYETVLSRIAGDNPLFRIAQYLFVGVSLGLALVVAYHQVLTPMVRTIGVTDPPPTGVLYQVSRAWLYQMIQRPSGEKRGSKPSMVPARRRSVSASRLRTQAS